MNEYFRVLSRYNAAANRSMYAILGELPPERLSQDVGGYFTTIRELLNHGYGSDVIWLRRFRTTRPQLMSLQSAEIDIEVVWPTVDLVHDFEELRTRRESLDALLERFTAELTDADLASVVDYTNSRGERKRYLFWQALMHMFNHETHHRGQMAEILDQLGVQNDYSNIITTLGEPS